MPGAIQSTISEFFGSGRQSRISMLAEGKLSNVKLSGYVEADFLSAAVTSNNNESNSYYDAATAGVGTGGVRQRLQLHRRADVEPGHRTKHGTDNRTEASAHDHRSTVYRRLQLGAAVRCRAWHRTSATKSGSPPRSKTRRQRSRATTTRITLSWVRREPVAVSTTPQSPLAARA